MFFFFFFFFNDTATTEIYTLSLHDALPISEPLDRQSRIPLYQRARGFGFPGVRVDGNDVLAVQAVTTKALDYAREGNGPILVEAFTYRMGAHTTTDDPTRYRMSSELE